MLPVGRAGFVGFCPLTLVHLCRVEGALSSLPLVSIPQRHEAPLYFWCETKRSWSQSPILWGEGWACCIIQSLALLSVRSSMLWTSTSSHPVGVKCAPCRYLWSHLKCKTARCPQGVGRYDTGSTVHRLIWNESQKPGGPQVAPNPTSGQPDPVLTGPWIAAATRSFLRYNWNIFKRSVLLWN